MSLSSQSSQPSIAIVTGAGSGIGHGAALALASAGCHVVLVGRTLSTLESSRVSICDAVSGASVSVHAADVSVGADVERLVDGVVQEHGRIDIIVNNAGAAPLVPLPDETREGLRAVLETNAIGPFDLVVRAWPIFLKQGQGAVVNVSSMAVADPLAGFGAYAASKCALDSLTRSIVSETPEGVDLFACSIAPGAVETPLLRGLFPVDVFPEDRTLSPTEVGALVAACALRQHPELHGQVHLLPSP